jgi:hypothetical protein
MSTFDWGFQPGSASFGESIPQDIGVAIQDELRKSQTVAFLTPQSASPDAQTSTGLGIQNVKRAFASKSTTDGTTVYVPTTLDATPIEVYPSAITTSVFCSGRPVMVFFRATFLHLATYPVSNLEGEMEARVNNSTSLFVQPCKAEETVYTKGSAIQAFGVVVPPAGSHSFSLWARSSSPPSPGSSEGPSIDGAAGIYMTVVEI